MAARAGGRAERGLTRESRPIYGWGKARNQKEALVATPPVHLLPHVLKAGGVPAAIGAVIAGFLSFPQSETSVNSFGVVVTTYHSSLTGAGLTAQAAVFGMIGYVIVGALIGLAVGFLLVATGISRPKDLGMED